MQHVQNKNTNKPSTVLVVLHSSLTVHASIYSAKQNFSDAIVEVRLTNSADKTNKQFQQLNLNKKVFQVSIVSLKFKKDQLTVVVVDVRLFLLGGSKDVWSNEAILVPQT